jgi:hypothetical protein
MSTSSKPVAPPVISLDSTGVHILSPPPNETDIVDAGDPVQFRLELKISGWAALVWLYTSEPVQISHYTTQVQTNDVAVLGPYPFVTPATAALLSAGFDFTTGPFTTGLFAATATANFTTASGDDDGVYRVVTVLQFTDAPGNSVVDDRILTVVKP